jgi:hypothetical protein
MNEGMAVRRRSSLTIVGCGSDRGFEIGSAQIDHVICGLGVLPASSGMRNPGARVNATRAMQYGSTVARGVSPICFTLIPWILNTQEVRR